MPNTETESEADIGRLRLSSPVLWVLQNRNRENKKCERFSVIFTK